MPRTKKVKEPAIELQKAIEDGVASLKPGYYQDALDGSLYYVLLPSRTLRSRKWVVVAIDLDSKASIVIPAEYFFEKRSVDPAPRKSRIYCMD